VHTCVKVLCVWWCYELNVCVPSNSCIAISAHNVKALGDGLWVVVRS
jgi:hypothetical protein